jgi:DNA replication and repair protein RecF
VHVALLALQDFRSYAAVEVAFAPGVSVLRGRNGQGKTNLAEAIGYAATQSSHRVATDAPLVRHGAARAIVRTAVVRGAVVQGGAPPPESPALEDPPAGESSGRRELLEIEINPGKTNRARLNRSPLSRARDILGILRTVLFAPEDLTLVKGDPGERRRFLDELLTARAPRFSGVRADYDRVLKQRNALLKSAAAHRRPPSAEMLATLDVWDTHLAAAGAELLAARLALTAALRPLVAKAYEALAPGGGVGLDYRSSLDERGFSTDGAQADRGQLAGALRAAMEGARRQELERGVSLVGPHRDELLLKLADIPARGYASQGEAWSFALALRLAAFELLRADGDDPVLILDDVFAELDTGRRRRLAEMVAPAEQVIITAAVPADVPGELRGAAYDVADGEVTRV